MATRAEIDLVVRALNRLSLSARSDFLSVWSRLDPTDWAATRRVLEDFWPDLIGHYGDMATALAADQVALDGTTPQSVRGVDPARANARMRWAIGVPDQLGSMLVILDELVKQPYRSTVQRSAGAAGTGWARVPSGAETCEWCLMLSSRGFVYESANAAGEGRKYHGECVIPGTIVGGPSALAALRREYEGVVVDITTAAGHHLTVTPNHPVLTSDGWVPSGALREGDELLSATGEQGHVVGGPSEDDSPALAEDRFRSLSMVTTATRGTVPGSPEQFHGDGGYAEVEIVARDGLLWNEVQASLDEGLPKANLAIGPGMLAARRLSLDGLGSRDVVGSGPVRAAAGGVGFLDLGESIRCGHPGGSHETGVGVSSDSDPGLLEDSTDRGAGDAKGLRDRVLAFPGEVPGDDIFRKIEGSRSVRRDTATVIAHRFYRGHVYNFQTADGWYFANSIVTHNCDCVPVLGSGSNDYPDGYDPDELYDRYAEARREARSGDPKKILKAAREMYGTN